MVISKIEQSWRKQFRRFGLVKITLRFCDVYVLLRGGHFMSVFGLFDEIKWPRQKRYYFTDSMLNYV